MYSVFNWTNKNSSDLQQLSMLQEARKGILGIPSSYNMELKKWKQAHTQGAFVITMFIMKNQKTKVIEIEETAD